MANTREMKVNFGKLESDADDLKRLNNDLRNKLDEIKTEINSLSSTYESDASEKIRAKITGMEGKFDNYFGVIENYEKYIRNVAIAWRSTESARTSAAEEFQ